MKLIEIILIKKYDFIFKFASDFFVNRRSLFFPGIVCYYQCVSAFRRMGLSVNFVNEFLLTTKYSERKFAFPTVIVFLLAIVG